MTQNPSQKFWNLPNSITFGRLLIAPVLILFLLIIEHYPEKPHLGRWMALVSGLVFAVAMATDMLDGYLARRAQTTSTFGKFLDPLADKLLFITAMIMMVPLGWIPAWLVAIFFVREVTITALRGIAVEEGIVIDASHWGKYKSAFVSSATTCLLLHYPFLGVHWNLIGWALMVPSFLLSIGSGLHYVIRFFIELPKRRLS
ncbi:MAG: CDP-diacylglycerol--glycerol-3-phosphate 3-phosphatidyltransferase [Pseudomonadota bacterium]